MTTWVTRAPEERGLLAPCFSAILIWYAAIGHQAEINRPFSFEASFLVLPIVLHGKTRDSLPRSISTSLPVWLEENPLVRSHIADRARRLAAFTKEALAFGGMHGLLLMKGSALSADLNQRTRVATTLIDTSDEVRTCAKRSEFVGKWFGKTGDGRTVLALMGVRV
jgi:hypothetical protein